MTDNKLSTKEILELKARAHHLHPVVMVGQQGLTESVIKETDAALTAHELIKVRVFGDDRTEYYQSFIYYVGRGHFGRNRWPLVSQP